MATKEFQTPEVLKALKREGVDVWLENPADDEVVVLKLGTLKRLLNAAHLMGECKPLEQSEITS